MAIPTFQQIADGIEARLETITGLRVGDLTPDQVNPPSAFVSVPPIPDYRATFNRGRLIIEFAVTVVVSAAYARTGQRELLTYVDISGDHSIPAAIEGDKTLGGVVDDCYVSKFGGEGLMMIGTNQYYGGVFTVPVAARGVES